ncbi:hypothetical protein [Kangiella sp. HZ709]|uniref:hypothetical protein n=1 Tax=Kangiella sp. HZ709 TaxID=2666328 RepID=UPI0012B060BD|nr:hypothetical protein [Kangiella sp. HZ709]MRX27307.1 hypothetical protein [Kangiella sp. HZ709]
MKLSFLFALLISLASCQAAKDKSFEKGPEKKLAHHGIIKGNKGQIVEICPELTKGQSISFTFNSNLPVTFNFHYHLDNETVYPVTERNLSEFNYRYKAEQDNVYCFMWESLLDNTKTKYQYSLIN